MEDDAPGSSFRFVCTAAAEEVSSSQVAMLVSLAIKDRMSKCGYKPSSGSNRGAETLPSSCACSISQLCGEREVATRPDFLKVGKQL